jgi:hypothetical protein
VFIYLVELSRLLFRFGSPAWPFRRTFSVKLRPAPGRKEDSSKVSAPLAVAGSGSQDRYESAVDGEVCACDVTGALACQQHDKVGNLFGACERPCYRVVSFIDTSYMLNVLDW